ncbi:hypothetical protein SLEP1_g28234 [Rubroshorea leprosula]|uniref:Uncharacterized protein n=1 Tax=Rubroshorea leprosula TaxID=152421 RepID=A0AAV5JZ33_9ROSI|nr:hypothetical protein SLEP1_g28234 [Rubroshorea leprosula]
MPDTTPVEEAINRLRVGSPLMPTKPVGQRMLVTEEDIPEKGGVEQVPEGHVNQAFSTLSSLALNEIDLKSSSSTSMITTPNTGPKPSFSSATPLQESPSLNVMVTELELPCLENPLDNSSKLEI